MSKLIPFLFAGVGASSVSVGGVFMLKKTGGSGTANTTSNGNESQTPSTTTTISSDLGFKTLSEFKDKKGDSCVHKHFSNNVDFSTGATIDSSSNKIEATYFDSSSGNPESCLIINWEKTSSTENTNPNKWTGSFRWLWSFKKENKGFVMFVAAAPSTSAPSKLTLEGGIYFLSRASSSSNWTVEKKKELATTNPKTIETSGDTFTKLFPKKGEAIKESDVQDYWGFVSGSSDLNNLCPSTTGETCPTSPTTKSNNQPWIWTFAPNEDANAKEIKSWSENFDTWANELFVESDSCLKGLFSKFKGSWAKQTIPSS